MVDAYRGNELVRAKAHRIVFDEAECEPRAKASHAVAIAEWVQDEVTYVNEGMETFQSPVRTLTTRYGDCDDFTTVIAAMCEAIGIRCELVGLEWDGQYRHIFPRAVIPAPGGKIVRLPLDATLRTPVGRLTNPIEVAIRKGRKVRALAL